MADCFPYAASKEDLRFKIAMQTVYKHEGHLSNDSDDPGGITNYGISLRYLRASHIDINNDGKIDKNDIIKLTMTEADSIYFKQWYLQYHYNLLTNQKILTKILDLSVNVGACEAHKLIKRAINLSLITSNILINCELEDNYLRLINTISPTIMDLNLISQQEKFYQTIVKNNPALHVFLKGWLARAYD